MGIVEWLGVAMGVANFIGLIYFVAVKQARIESRVEILWSFIMRRGILEAISGGVMEHNSPLVVPDRIRQKYAELFGKVLEYYDREGKTLTDLDLILGIENNFWRDILVVCSESNLRMGGCLVMIAKIIRPEMKIFTDFEVIERNVQKNLQSYTAEAAVKEKSIAEGI